MNIAFSRNLAIFIGLLAPLLETIRRWHTWQDDPLAFFDDYILGGLLLFGAWRVTKDVLIGRKFLVAGWGFALGLAYASVDFQLQQVRAGAADPAPISTGWVAIVKVVGFAIILIGLISSLRMRNAEI
jgi:hypothetical protein